MARRALISLALLLTAACASLPMNSSSNATAGGSSTPNFYATDYVLLSAPTQLRTIDESTTVYPLHVRGALTNRGFYPLGKVEGHGDLCTDGKDWLSLSDLKVHKAAEGGSPAAPYLLGCASNSGFKPASRDIVMAN
jgi:ABC-type phosphate transport system substrate-binding protein